MNLILLEPAEIDADGLASLSGPRAAHIRGVLGAGPGASVRIGVTDGPLGLGTVVASSDARVELRCALEETVPERPRVDVLLAVPRPKVLRRLWAHLSAVGVGRIILTNAEKVERDYFGSHWLDEGRGFRSLLIEGLQQARDTRVPVVSIHKRFRVLVEDELDQIAPDTVRLVAHPSDAASEARPVAAALAGIGPGPRVLVAIGPEGGWNDFELRLLEAHGFARVSLGSRTLATTTASIAVLSLVHDALRRG